MDLSEDWKSLWPISSVHSPPLLLSNPPSSTLFGPLFFNPIPNTTTPLLTSPSSLSPPILTPPPSLSLARFLQTTTSPHSSILPSTSSAISSAFGMHYLRDFTSYNHNRVEILRCPNNRILIFFTTGDNLDRVGFIALSVRDTNFVVHLDPSDNIFMSMNEFNHRIFLLSACPVNCSFSSSGSNDVHVGFLMACTMYSVHWFSVRIKGLGSDSEKPVLLYLGDKLFKSCAVVHACWNPHLPEESMVLLESGELFLFDVNSSSASSSLWNFNARFRGKRLRPFWDELGGYEKNGWFSCVFSWHPRILVVANSNAVFLMDFRFEKCHVSCLLKIQMLSNNSLTKMDRFVAFSKAGPDDFYFVVASEHFLLLCDIRKPLMPVLQWVHGLHEPSYITVLRLSELRSNSSTDAHKHPSETGFGIVLGSFWKDDFSLFCYGPYPPPPPKAFSSKISKFCNSFYAWELPSQLSLSGCDCHCGSCLLRMAFAKDYLPEWTEWQEKKELVLGFYILDKDLYSLSSKQEEYGGFILIRLMSSGKLEAQRYCASWNMVQKNRAAHEEFPLHLKDSLLSHMGNEEYKFVKRFQYLKLDYLYGHLNGVLARILFSNSKRAHAIASWKKYSSVHSHEFLCEKLKVFSLGAPISSLSVADVFRDISMPTTIYEVASRRMWTMLPMDILGLSFCDYKECFGFLIGQKKMSLEFLTVPDQTQLPPFFLRNPSRRSNKWSSKTQPGNDFVGPVLPLPACLALVEIQKNSNLEKAREFSSEAALLLQCDVVMNAAKEIGVVLSSHNLHKEFAVSLVDDREETWPASQSSHSFFLYKPTAFFKELSDIDSVQKDHEDERFTMTIAKLPEKLAKKEIDLVDMELFNDLCPVELRFDNHNITFEPDELKAYKLLKRQFSKWQDGFTPYQDFCAKLQNQKQDQVFG
ncbi:hypothetical protein Nepgr_017947 [Nepenthes gracilis]|uniref:Uncharacterized protein n=1 Tax=Nepenthes gracilis TaxID=150966 RepID=A0AAD3SSX7_NEPGR|nr:hypothetical protein Nepgr_017947 [Nepenthes gracilis]